MAKNCLIYEALNDVKSMSVTKKEDGLMTLSGVFGVCGVRNNNQRVYETANYTKMVQEMQARIQKDGAIPGELEHPQVMNVNLENISHKITEINIDENGLVTGTIALLNTPKGKLAQALVEGGLPLHISSRATGAVDSKTGNVTLERISTYDLVGTPGFSQARLNLNESQMADLEKAMNAEGTAEMDNMVFTQISESNVYYIAEKETNENNINENDMELKEILERVEALEAKIEVLQNENDELRESLEEATSEKNNLEKLCEGIQNWVANEYSPVVQQWVVEHYGEAQKDEILEEIEENAGIDKTWIAEKYSPMVQKWVVEECMPVIEKWCVEHLATGIQKWVVEEYAPESQIWMNETFMESVKEKITEMIAESKANNMNAIDETLTLLESMEAAKPTYSRKALIVENLNEPKFIQEMPADVRVKWDMASNEIKESIMRRAKLYNLTTEGAIDRFWSNINFTDIKPVANIYEGLEAVEDQRERDIRMKLRSSRFRK